MRNGLIHEGEFPAQSGFVHAAGVFVSFLFCVCTPCVRADDPSGAPDELFIVVDDLNDWISLRDPKANWDRPALMTSMRGNHAVRSERWRYIRYADGSEELYDHNADPNEWNNLADNEQFAELIAAHRRWLPKSEARQVSDLKKRKPHNEAVDERNS